MKVKSDNGNTTAIRHESRHGQYSLLEPCFTRKNSNTAGDQMEQGNNEKNNQLQCKEQLPNLIWMSNKGLEKIETMEN